MANEVADFDEQLDQIISSHEVEKAKEKRILRKKELKTQNVEKINSLKYEKLIKKSNQTFVLQILKLFHEENFCDLIIECDSLFKYLHSFILIARVPTLFEILKEHFIVGSDTSLVPVFDCPTAHSNPLYDNQFDSTSSFNSLNTNLVEEKQQQVIKPCYLHIRLPAELIQIFDLIGFLQALYSDEENIENLESELILVLNKIKVLKDQNLLNCLENDLKLNNNYQMNESLLVKQEQNDNNGCEMNEIKEDLNECIVLKNEPLYINIEKKNSSDDQFKNDQPNVPNETLKKDKTFLLSKIVIQNEQFEIDLLNDEDNQDIVNKLANIDNEIKEMENQIDSAAVIDTLCVDPENEEQQLITALSNEKIQINNSEEFIYGNIKKENTDTVSDVSEICDEYSVTSEIAKKYSDNLEARKLKIGDIELNFEKNENQEPCLNERNSLFYEMINIKNKVQKAVTNERTEVNDKKELLKQNNEVYSSYDNDVEEERTLSGSMIRSGTFNLQCHTPINDLIESKLKTDSIKLSESDDDSSLSKKIEQDSLMSDNNRSNKYKITDFDEKESISSKKSLQYFLNETEIIAKQQEIDEMEQSMTSTKTNSGLFFIDFDDPHMSKSSTFDRKKNKMNQKAKSVGESSLNSSFIDDKKLVNNNQRKQHYQESDLLPMSMITTKKDAASLTNERINRSIEVGHQNDGIRMFRLSNNHYKTISGTSITPGRTSKSASTLRDTNLKKTKSEITNSTVQENDTNEVIVRKSFFSCSRLGEDLLKLFTHQINCDFSISVADKSQELQAHKAILMARSDFFSKKFLNNFECNQIDLSDFSYDSVHFILTHIYSGTINIPNFSDEERTKCLINNDLNGQVIIDKEYTELNLTELLCLSDLFQLNILKDVILFEIKKNYCHHFHKPCNDCIVGVINCLNLARKCEIASLYNCCISWICRNYKKIWPTKQFATLFNQPASNHNCNNSPRNTPTRHKKVYHQPVHKNNEIINSIYTAILDSLTNENVIDKILNFQQLVSSMTRFKWNELIIQLIEELIEDFCKYLAINYDQIVSSQTFIQLGFDKSWQLDILENYLILAVDSMKCETALRTFVQLENIVIMCESVNDCDNIYANTSSRNQFSDEFVRTVQKLYKNIERYLIHNANEAVYCESWNELSPNIQDYIKNSAVLVFEFEKPLAKRPVLSSSMKSREQQSANVKRKNMSSAKKTSSEDRTSDQSRQSTLTKQSARSNRSTKENDKLMDDNHIYDEVPLDLLNEIKEKNLSSNNIPEYSKVSKETKKSNTPQSVLQVAKVQPFSVLPTDLNISNLTTNLISSNYENYEELLENNYENIIYDESIGLQKIGSESSLASSTLQEADLLEQELTKKVQNQRMNALKQTKLQQSNKPNSNIGSPQLRTSLRCRNRQSANSNSSTTTKNSISSTNRLNNTKSSRSSNKKPPFK